MGDGGVDSGATIISNVTASQTQIAISNHSKLLVNDTIAIDDEQMKVLTLVGGPPWPDTMTVSRAFNGTHAATHKASAHIYRATTDGNHDGKNGYTPGRDVNLDLIISSTDLLWVAMVMGTTCPSSP